MANEQIRFDVHRLRSDVLTGVRPLRITIHAQTEAFKEKRMMKCSICFEEFGLSDSHIATQVYRRYSIVVTVTGIPAVAHCPNCGNAILDWEVAQQVENLVQPLFN